MSTVPSLNLPLSPQYQQTSQHMRHLYEFVPGLFLNGDADLPNNPVQILPRFGLVDSSPERWENLKKTISHLNASAEKGTSYRVIFVGRHGQGFHNVAEKFYGSEEWNKHQAKLTGDGNITWGPDPKLTKLGIEQAQIVNSAWITELSYGIPLPQSSYSSPLTRAIHTALITFDGIPVNKLDSSQVYKRPVIKEKLREVIGVHTCDKRSPQSHITKEFPQFDIEPGFSEEDLLWRSDHRETEVEVTTRIQESLDEIFSKDSATYISITTHGGACRAMMRAFGISPYELPVGGVTVFVVKVMQHEDAR